MNDYSEAYVSRNEKRKEFGLIVFFFLVFLFLFTFFAKIYPLVVYDADDWTYISYRRHAFPIWSNWNPTKIFPETFLSFCGDFAVNVVDPFVNDYLSSLTYSFSLAASIFIIVYLWLFFNLLRSDFSLSGSEGFLLTLFFLVFHFSVFKGRQPSDNIYLFYSYNLTNFFNYTMSALLNMIMVLYFQYKNQIIWKSNFFLSGFLFFFIYLAVFSNLFQSIIIVSYAGCRIIIELFGIFRNKQNQWKDFFDRNVFFSFCDITMVYCVIV